ncbi:hypothetical protein AAZX31_06G068900 [Glycine max]
MITEREVGVLLSVHVKITTSSMPQSRRSLLGLEMLALVDSFFSIIFSLHFRVFNINLYISSILFISSCTFSSTYMFLCRTICSKIATCPITTKNDVYFRGTRIYLS